jgi:hypothetical protein
VVVADWRPTGEADECATRQNLLLTRRSEILEVADRYGVEGLHWWPPQPGDFVVEGLPDRLRSLQADLERILGCRVAIYLIEHWPHEHRRRLEGEMVQLGNDCPGP